MKFRADPQHVIWAFVCYCTTKCTFQSSMNALNHKFSAPTPTEDSGFWWRDILFSNKIFTGGAHQQSINSNWCVVTNVADMKSSTEFTLYAFLPASFQLEPNSEPPRTLGIPTTPPNTQVKVRKSGQKNGTSDTLLHPYPYKQFIRLHQYVRVKK